MRQDTIGSLHWKHRQRLRQTKEALGYTRAQTEQTSDGTGSQSEVASPMPSMLKISLLFYLPGFLALLCLLLLS